MFEVNNSSASTVNFQYVNGGWVEKNIYSKPIPGYAQLI